MLILFMSASLLKLFWLFLSFMKLKKPFAFFQRKQISDLKSNYAWNRLDWPSRARNSLKYITIAWVYFEIHFSDGTYAMCTEAEQKHIERCGKIKTNSMKLIGVWFIWWNFDGFKVLDTNSSEKFSKDFFWIACLNFVAGS